MIVCLIEFNIELKKKQVLESVRFKHQCQMLCTLSETQKINLRTENLLFLKIFSVYEQVLSRQQTSQSLLFILIKFNIKAGQREALGRSCNTKLTYNFPSLKINIKVFYLILHRDFLHQQEAYVKYQAVSRPKIFLLYHCFQKTVAFFESNKMRTDKNISFISIIKIAFYQFREKILQLTFFQILAISVHLMSFRYI